jgi:hypothetical protein
MTLASRVPLKMKCDGDGGDVLPRRATREHQEQDDGEYLHVAGTQCFSPNNRTAS